jgi:hypothetical protein
VITTLDCFPHLSSFQLSQINDVRIFRIANGLLVELEIDEAWSAVSMANLVQPRVAHDDEEPTLQSTAVIRLLHRRGGTHVRFLDEIFGICFVAREHHREAVERINVLESRLTKRCVFCRAVHHVSRIAQVILK